MKVMFLNSMVFDQFNTWALEDKKIYKKIVSLIKDIERDPYNGIGKPEGLKYELSGYWSRRIDETHRLVYQINEEEENTLIIISCKTHYKSDIEQP